MEAQMKDESIVKYLRSKDTTIEDNEANQVEMIKLLPADAALKVIALKICMTASETETKG